MKFRSPGSQALHIALLSGHTLVIPPEGVEVAAEFRREAIARGAEPMAADPIERSPAAVAALTAMLAQGAATGAATGATSTGSTEAQNDAAAAALAAENRKQMVKAAIKQMLEGNNEADFTADGKPNLNVLKKVAGFNVSRQEADEAWEALQAEAAEAGDEDQE
ncbi:hypothetical protein ACJJWD_09495 [Comamonas testosteroni]|uniref:hypothetical protein n=1 Tax=Comamonas testosteroni TaxID=285 RepID=UPI003899E387